MSYLIECLRVIPTYWLPAEYPLLDTEETALRGLSLLFQLFVSGLLLALAGIGVQLAGIRWRTARVPASKRATEQRVWAYLAGMTLVFIPPSFPPSQAREFRAIASPQIS